MRNDRASLAVTVDQAFGTRRNNFDLMRLGAALLVLFSHSFVLCGAAGGEPVAMLLGHKIDGGGLAVSVFFVISGFLIARSAMRSTGYLFVRARFLRIYPAYAVTIVLQTFGLGLAASTLSSAAYLGEEATWQALARGLLLNPKLGLPGVFADNPLPYQVNGSLWTLRIEALCYAGALLVCSLRFGRVALCAAAFGAACAALAVVPLPGGWLRPVLMNVGLFLAAMLFWFARAAIVLDGWLALGLAVSLPLLARTSLFEAATFIVLPYLVLYLGLAARLPAWLRPKHDLSYGVYLYAFPIQQCIVLQAPHVGPYALAAAAVGPVLVLAWLSFRLVEAPSLRRKQPTATPSRSVC